MWIKRSQNYSDHAPPSPMRSVNSSFLMNTMAIVEMRKGDPAAAEQTLLEAIAAMKRSAPELYPIEGAILLHNMARLHVATGRPDTAIGFLTDLLSQQPSDSSAWFDRAIIHQRAGRLVDALQDYDAALRWEPAHIEAHFNRAQVLSLQQRYEEAIIAYGRVLVLQPDYVDAWLERALLMRRSGKVRLARRDVREVLRLDPQNAKAHCLHGLLEMGSGNHRIAAASFTRAIECDPSLADAWANRAIVFAREGRLEDAESGLTKALSIRHDPVILLNRARIYEKLRRWLEAAEDYRQALAIAGSRTKSIRRRYMVCLRELHKSDLVEATMQ